MIDIKLSELITKLKPYVLGWIETSGSGQNGLFAPSPHSISGPHHSGTLNLAQYPDALSRDGSRPLFGNMAVATGITIDGVDISAHFSDYQVHLLNKHAHHQAFTGIATNNNTVTPNLNDTIIFNAGMGLYSNTNIANTITIDIGSGAGLSLTAEAISLTTPGTLNTSSTNNSTGNHTHAITTSGNPGLSSSILKTSNAGVLRLQTLAIGNIQEGFLLYQDDPQTVVIESENSGLLQFSLFSEILFPSWSHLSSGLTRSTSKLSFLGPTSTLTMGIPSESSNVDIDLGLTGNQRLRSKLSGNATINRPGTYLWDSFQGLDKTFIGARDADYSGFQGLSGGNWGFLMSNVTGAVGINMGLTEVPDAMLKVLGDVRFHGGDFRVTSPANPNIIHVSAFNRVAIAGPADDPQFALKVHGALFAKVIVGKHAVQLQDVKLLAHFDGPGQPSNNYKGRATGHKGQIATITGGVTFRYGLFDTKAIQFGPATVNKIPNPSFENNLDYWSVIEGNWSRVTTDGHSGTSCGQLSNGTVYTPLTTSANTSKTFSVWAKGVTQGAFAQLSVGLVSTAYIPLVYGKWKRITITIIPDSEFIYWALSSQGTVRFDSVQLEDSLYPTPYLDGSLGQGHGWNQSEHASSSYRNTSLLQYDSREIATDIGSVMFWAQSPRWRANTQYCLLNCMTNGTITVSNLNVLTWSQNQSPISYVLPAWTDESWHLFCITYDHYNNRARLYVDGFEVGTSGYTTRTSLASINVGGFSLGTQPFSGAIDEFLISSVEIEADDIRAIYESKCPVFIETSTFEFTTGTQQTVWGDENGLSAVTINGDPAFAVAAQPRFWGGFNLGMGDVLIGKGSSYIRWNAQVNGGQGLLTIAGNGSGITSIDGGNISTGFLSANRIAAGSLDVSKLGITSITDNLILNPSAEQGTVGWALAEGSGRFDTESGGFKTEGSTAFVVSASGQLCGVGCRPLALVPGDKYTVRVKARGSIATLVGLYIRINEKNTFPTTGYITDTNRTNYYDFVNSGPITSSWTTYEFVYTVPANIFWGSFAVYGWGNEVMFDEAEMRKQLGSVHIEDGAITASKIFTTSLAAINADIGLAVITEALTIGLNGEIRQGTGILGSSFTGFRLWRDGNIGRMAGYNNNVIQWSTDTDGKLRAGAGAVQIDVDGLTTTENSQHVKIAGSGITRYSSNVNIPALVGRDLWKSATNTTLADMKTNFPITINGRNSPQAMYLTSYGSGGVLGAGVFLEASDTDGNGRVLVKAIANHVISPYITDLGTLPEGGGRNRIELDAPYTFAMRDFSVLGQIQGNFSFGTLGQISMEGRPLYLRNNGDTNHRLMWQNNAYSLGFDGPTLSGYNGGALATGINGAPALYWTNTAVTVTGNLNYQGALTYTSDSRLKKNITNYTQGIEILKLLRPTRGEYNGLAGTVDNQSYVGLIAQEVEEVLPALVVHRRGIISGISTLIKNINERELLYMLINTVVQQDKRLELLEQSQ